MNNKYRTLKNILRILLIFIALILLLSINTLGYSDLLDRIVKIFVFSSPVLVGIGAYLKRKEDEIREDS